MDSAAFQAYLDDRIERQVRNAQKDAGRRRDGLLQGALDCRGKTMVEILSLRIKSWADFGPLCVRQAAGDLNPDYDYHLGYDQSVEEVALQMKNWLLFQ